MQQMWSTFSKAAPGAAVNQLNQNTRHVMGAQHAIDNADAVKRRTSTLLVSAVEGKPLLNS